MQTFLPYPSVWESVLCLDNKRLGKQRVEAWQLIDILTKKEKSKSWRWYNHPAVKMWDGYIDALKFYYNMALITWDIRGFNNIKLQMIDFLKHPSPLLFPKWFGDDKFHSAHRAALLYKDYDYYKHFGWKEKPKLNYYWPIN